MNKHTPGPWSAELYENACYFEGVSRDGWAVNGPNMVPDYECPLFNEADARLIAAAPELLEALKDALCALECCGKDYPAATKALAAIAKATGENK